MHYAHRISVFVILAAMGTSAIAKDNFVSPEEETRQFCSEQNKDTQEIIKSEIAFFVKHLLESLSPRLTAFESKMERSLQDLSQSFNNKLITSDLSTEKAFASLSESLNNKLTKIDMKMDKIFGNLSNSLNQLQLMNDPKIDNCFRNVSEPIHQHFSRLTNSYLGLNATTEEWRHGMSTVETQTATTTAVDFDHSIVTTMEMENTTRTENLGHVSGKTGKPTSTVAPVSSACSALGFKFMNQTKASDNIVVAGVGAFREPLYICKAFVNGKYFIGKATSSECWIAYNNTEVGSKGSVFKDFRILINPMKATLTWKPSSQVNTISSESVVASAGIKDCYIGRGRYENQILPGLVNTITRELTASYRGAVYRFSKYEALVCT